MTFEQMKESLKTIRLLEQDLMRDLTSEEKNVVINEGWEELLFGEDHLNMSDEEFEEMKYLRNIISAFYTQDECVLNEFVENAPDEVYFVLRQLADLMEKSHNIANELKEKPETAFSIFMNELYKSLPERDAKWFENINDSDMRNQLFKIFEVEKNNQSKDALCGIMTDAVKDVVIDQLVSKLKSGEEVEMTEDEFSEVANYLFENEKNVKIRNINGKVKLF